MVLVVVMSMVVMGELAIPAVVMSTGFATVVAMVMMMMMGKLTARAAVMSEALSTMVAIVLVVMMIVGKLTVPDHRDVRRISRRASHGARIARRGATALAGKAMGPGHRAP